MSIIDNMFVASKSGEQVLIRNARMKDAEDIIGINKSVISEGSFMLREPPEAIYNLANFRNEIENYFQSRNHIYIVAEIENKVAGYIEFRNGVFKRTSHTGMFSMFILKQYRQQGIGKILLDTLVRWAQKNPLIEKITLSVFSTNIRAQNLYLKCGFVEEGRCPKDMKLNDGTYIDSVLMYKFVK